MPYGDVYNLRHSASVSTAITVLQIATGTTCPALILSAGASQRGSTISAQEELAFVRKTAAATVTAAVIGTHLFKLRTGDPTPALQLGAALTGVIATAEGTDGDVCFRSGFNVLNGWVYLPVPEERLFIPAAGILGLKYMTAPGGQNWDWNLSIMELGS